MKKYTEEHFRLKAPGFEFESFNPGFYSVILLGLLLIFFAVVVVYRRRKV